LISLFNLSIIKKYSLLKGVWGMPGKIKRLIDDIIEKRAGGNQVLQSTLRTKLILRGIDPKKYDENSPDDETIINKLIEFSRV
jgi:hypothetical protein